MTVKDVMIALRAVNPNFTLSPQTFHLEGFGDQDLMPGLEVTEQMAANEEKARERFSMEFTLPPNREVLWGLMRQSDFTLLNMPTMENILAGLRKKYGQESGSRAPNETFWIFDPQGKQIAGRPAIDIKNSCQVAVGGLGQQDATSVYNFVIAGIDCSKVAIVNVAIQEALGRTYSDGRLVPKGLASRVTVWMVNNALRRSGSEATRAVALNASKARDAQDTEDAKKRGAPKF
jgi:hypothetical protein